MKKLICLLLAFTLLALPVTATAATPRLAIIVPTLSFDGTTATCSLIASSDYSTDKISAVLQLWDGNSCIATWSASGTGALSMSRTKTVTKGVEYTLTANVIINGVAQPRASMTKKCE